MNDLKQEMSSDIGILILAGGQGSRMGGADKGWVEIAGKTLIQTLLDNLKIQCDEQGITPQIVISANRNIEAYEMLGHSVVIDQRSGYQGPLAGIEAALSTKRLESIKRWVVCPVDTPVLPESYLKSMLRLKAEEVGYLIHNQRHHYAHLSLPSSFQSELKVYMRSGQRSIKGLFLGSKKANPVVMQNDGFYIENINSLKSDCSHRFRQSA